MRVENLAVSGAANPATPPNNSKTVAAAETKVETAQENQEIKLNNEKERLQEAIAYANKALEGSHRSFRYEIHEPTNAVIISVIDDKTNEVIGEIPARKLLDTVSRLMELAGLVVDERR